jgi:hypothetical protein
MKPHSFIGCVRHFSFSTFFSIFGIGILLQQLKLQMAKELLDRQEMKESLAIRYLGR